MRPGVSMMLTDVDRERLDAIVRDRNSPRKHVWRARIVLLTAAGLGTNAVMRETGKSKTCVWRWRERFMAEGVGGLVHDKTRPSRIRPLGQAILDRVIALTNTKPPYEATHWTAGAMAEAVGVSASSVQRIWRAHQLRPHRFRSFKLSTDPAFADKVRAIVGLYVDPPAHGVVLSIDEKSRIQALDRAQPSLPMKPGRLGTMTHDYKRHGTTTLFAALNVLDGRVIGRNMQRHRHQEFTRFLNAVERAVPGRQDRPRRRRQLCHPQAPQGSCMAGPSSALDLPFHPHLVLVAECRRGLLRQALQAPARAWRLPLRRRSSSRHRPLHRRDQR